MHVSLAASVCRDLNLGYLNLNFHRHYLLVTTVCRFFFLRRAGRPQVLQNIIDMRKRLKGVPTSGTVSIVVTDIEDFSGVWVVTAW